MIVCIKLLHESKYVVKYIPYFDYNNIYFMYLTPLNIETLYEFPYNIISQFILNTMYIR